MREIGPTLVEGNNTSQLRINAMSITARIMESLIPQKRNITRNPGSWRFSNWRELKRTLKILLQKGRPSVGRLSSGHPYTVICEGHGNTAQGFAGMYSILSRSGEDCCNRQSSEQREEVPKTALPAYCRCRQIRGFCYRVKAASSELLD